MPRLADPQEEIYARERAHGANQTQAAHQAGFNGHSANKGSRLARRQDIQTRITEIQTQLTATPNESPNLDGDCVDSSASDVYLTKPWQIIELVTTHRLARKYKDFGVSIQALRTLAQMGGHLADGSGRPVTQRVTNMAFMGPVQLNQVLKTEVGALPQETRETLIEAAPELAEYLEP